MRKILYKHAPCSMLHATYKFIRKSANLNIDIEHILY